MDGYTRELRNGVTLNGSGRALVGRCGALLRTFGTSVCAYLLVHSFYDGRCGTVDVILAISRFQMQWAARDSWRASSDGVGGWARHGRVDWCATTNGRWLSSPALSAYRSGTNFMNCDDNWAVHFSAVFLFFFFFLDTKDTEDT